MKLKARLNKGPQVKFISHLDLMKTIEKALRRAQIPIAFSQGFNPHPKLSLASALAVGVTSEAEYLEMELAQEVPVREVMERLNRVLPPGLELTAIGLAEEKEKPLMATVNAASYELQLRVPDVECGRLSSSLESFLALATIPFTKDSKSGKAVTVDLRPGIWQMTISRCDHGEATVEMLVETGSRLNVKPQELVALWLEHAGIGFDAGELVIHRRGLYIHADGKMIEPVPLER